ncbi:MAG TPA: VOC family protein, partial [Candidatus Poseidoniia archaeon]|nr:VOC family protein [Candidatus Poseidoniia archaeon]
MTKDPVPLKAIHHIEFWVGNAKQAAHFYRTAFGFNQIAYSGLETGDREKASYVLEQGKVRLILSTPLSGDNGISSHIKKHGDGVKDIAFHVNDAAACYKACIERGAKSAA